MINKTTSYNVIKSILIAGILFCVFVLCKTDALALSSVKDLEIEMHAENTAELRWDIYASDDIACFCIERFKPSAVEKYKNDDKTYSLHTVKENEIETVALITNVKKRSALIPVTFGEGWVYTVSEGKIPEKKTGYSYQNPYNHTEKDPSTGKEYEIVYYTRSTGILFTPSHYAVPIKEAVAGEKKVILSWDKEKEATGYQVYTSSAENGTAVLKKTLKATDSSCEIEASPGETAFYRLKTLYKNGASDLSVAKQVILPNQTGKTSVTLQAKIRQAYRNGQYSWSWASADKVYYYEEGKIFYVVSQVDNKLFVYGLDQEGKCVSQKKIKLDKGYYFGGFYHGSDGNQYVVEGCDNLSEKDSKVVIRVVKFDKNWKKKKAAKIKGNATNSFKGIYRPFDAANVRMDMKNTTLRIVTGRTMYKLSDGLHHQSNIAFCVNTVTMTARVENLDYTSHSFNQYVRYKDNEIYELNHGDAYPRAVKLTVGKVAEDDSISTGGQRSYNLFKILGKTGQNYTGVSVGGMEVGSKNVLCVGSAQPHTFKIKGVKGFGNYGYNVFLTVTDRKTGETKVNWLTKNNPKKLSLSIRETRMVKLSDDYYAILFNQTKGGKNTLIYYVVNQDGKKIYQKKYPDIPFTASSQPVLHRGFLTWTENVDQVVRLVSIPVKF